MVLGKTIDQLSIKTTELDKNRKKRNQVTIRDKRSGEGSASNTTEEYSATTGQNMCHDLCLIFMHHLANGLRFFGCQGRLSRGKK